MEITEVRVKLMEEAGERLQAFCSITFDDAFVVRDLKIIEGTTGPFVAMPSRKLTAHCSACGCKNHLRAVYCNHCGGRLKELHAMKDDDGRAKLYADIAHPINSACRELIQQRVIEAYEKERARSRLPGYVPNFDDFDDEGYIAPPQPASNARPPRNTRPTQADSTHIQPAEKPRGPHRIVAVASSNHQPSHPRQAELPSADLLHDNVRHGETRVGDGFGAGIFE